MTNPSRVVVIGSGFAGLAAACRLAKAGFAVTVLEKNAQLGGRAQTWKSEGFTFDMGPSWYWMPDVFEDFFANFGKKTSDYYDLVRLDPSYRVFGVREALDIPASYEKLKALFESLEPGAGDNLDAFLAQASYKYRVGMGDYVRRPSLAIGEFIDPKLIGAALRIQMVQSMRQHVAAYFQDPRIVQIMEFPVLFLGGTARQIPAMYSLMNYADISLGTWYPMGGMAKIIDGIVTLARELGVQFRTGTEASRILVERGRAVAVEVAGGERLPADVVIGAGDYHYIEQRLLSEQHRTYSKRYWESRVMSPSSLLFYLGINRRLENLKHHNLFFDEGLDQHAREIYDKPQWPTRPLFYACCPSQTDPTVAPEGSENLFLLMPVAPGLQDNDTIRERYYNLLMSRLERITGQSIRDAVVVKRSYAHRDFIADYNAYKGNAYGLANTLRQTAIFKPRLQSRRVPNLFFAGQLTVPGPGVPPALISGQIVSEVILRQGNWGTAR